MSEIQWQDVEQCFTNESDEKWWYIYFDEACSNIKHLSNKDKIIQDVNSIVDSANNKHDITEIWDIMNKLNLWMEKIYLKDWKEYKKVIKEMSKLLWTDLANEMKKRKDNISVWQNMKDRLWKYWDGNL